MVLGLQQLHPPNEAFWRHPLAHAALDGTFKRAFIKLVLCLELLALP
jgi:hypothetical protein